MIYVALDLETTGLDAARDAIIEIGAVKFDHQRELGVFSSLVNPNRSIPLQISQLTGITDLDVMDAPFFSDLHAEVTRFVGRAVVVGHNVRFDLAFLRQWHCLTRHDAVDTFALATILMPHQSRYSLGKLIDSLGIEFTGRHRALDDARATMQLFRELQARAAHLPLETLQTINRAARGGHWALGRVFRDAERVRPKSGARRSGGDNVLPRTEVGEPLTPVDRRTALDGDELGAMLEPGGAFSQTFPGFEYRPQQVEMLRKVSRAFNQSRHVLVEAGTGTGKSMAYLLPAVHWAAQNGERVVVSTNTINLQDQLYSKDVPDLRKLLSFDVRAVVLKGRSNYLCLYRLEALQNRPGLTDDELCVLSRILVWLPNTITGDRAELFLPAAGDWAVWSQVSADTHTCMPERCVYHRQGRCFFYRARRLAENAHLVIVNHALLLADVASENRVLPAYNSLIVDEAHHLEDATTQQLGVELTDREIRRLYAQLGRAAGSPGGWVDRLLGLCYGRIPDELFSDLECTAAALREVNERAISSLDGLFQDLAVFIAEQGGNKGQYDHRVRLTGALRIQPDWTQIEVAWDVLSHEMRDSLERLERAVGILRDVEYAQIPGYDDLLQDGIGLARQLENVYAQIEAVLLQPPAGQVTWLRTRAKKDEISLCAAPLYVGHLVEQHLLWAKEAVIFTSATLRTNGDFNFIKERLGAPDAEELAVGSPFDYESQVLLCLPTDIPEPNQPYYQRTVSESLIVLARATQGRMLVLFTSYSQLRTVNKAIARPLADAGITVLAQGGGASRRQLLENLRTMPRTVLLGTRSFWEGVDVPGEALSCVALVKLPFAVPSDPVFAARSERMDEPFFQYAVPDAILRFRQGFGRLIRSKTDRGVVAVLDKRVQSKRYGEMFLRSLPVCTTVRCSLSEMPGLAERWIEQGAAGFQQGEHVIPDRQSQGSPSGVDGGELEYVSLEDY